jgi:glycosyltransferase involved in cell wall biosynthesis
MTPPVLDIIIPAYKARFLSRTLHSFSAQTDPRFSFFVFDDASPENIREVMDSCRSGLPMRYHRFDENRGREHLALHWNRCVERTSAPWIWLFSDDDLADPDCVASFYRGQKSGTNADVLRFDTTLIDEHDQCLRCLPPHPARETSGEFLLQRLRRRRWSFVPDHIFSRRAFIREGGFVDFPLGWHSDDATWAAFARQTGFASLDGARVSWRVSAENISGCGNSWTCREKAEASFQYYEWVSRFLEGTPGLAAVKARKRLPRYLNSQLFISGAPAYLEHLPWLAQRYTVLRGSGRRRAWMLMGFLWATRLAYEGIVRMRTRSARGNPA